MDFATLNVSRDPASAPNPRSHCIRTLSTSLKNERVDHQPFVIRSRSDNHRHHHLVIIMSTHNKLLDATASDDCSDDSDYAPPSPKASGSKRPASAASDNESSKRAKLDAEEADAKKEAAEAWASIMSVEEEAKKEREKALELKTDEDLVEVSRPRNFAGEVV